MNKIRQTVSELFSSPMDNMSFVRYIAYVNQGGKVTARSILELTTICLTFLEDQEKKNELYEANFKDMEEILNNLVQRTTDKDIDEDIEKLEELIPESIKDTPNLEVKSTEFICDECKKSFQSNIALMGHKRSHLPKKAV